jgi:hypothetical protein
LLLLFKSHSTKEFDPDFASKQKRPAAIPIAQAQANLRASSPITSPKVSPKFSPVLVVSPVVSSSVVSSAAPSRDVLSPREQELLEETALWPHEKAKFDPENDTVYCEVVSSFDGEKEGDLTCASGDVLACNFSQDFREEFWYGAKNDGEVGYFPQRHCKWIQGSSN